MLDGTALKVLMVAHNAVSRDIGRLRYQPLAGDDDLDVHVLAPASWREYGRTMTADEPQDVGITLHIERILVRHLPRIKWYAHFYPRLGRIIRGINPRIIHLWEEPWSVVALQAALLRGNAAFVLEVDQNIIRRLPPPFEAIRRFTLKRADLVLSRSPDSTAVVRACGFEGPVLPIGYGVDRDLFTAREEAAGRRGGGPLRIGYVGRLVEEKGLDDVLEAMRIAKCPTELFLMGEGPYEAKLKERAGQLALSNRVTILGWGATDEVAAFIKSLDVSLLLSQSTPTWCEQFGRVIIESQSCGVPVIGSTSGAIPDVIGGGGWIVPEHDPASLAALFDRLYRAPDEIIEKGAAGVENVESRFTYEATAKILAAAWREASAIQSAKRNKGSSSSLNFRIVQTVGELGTSGGVENAANELVIAWSRARIPNTTLTRKSGSRLPEDAVVEHVVPWLARLPMKGSSPESYLGRLFVVPAFTFAATLALRKHRNAILVSHNGDSPGDVMVVHSLHAAMLEVKRDAGVYTWLLNPLNIFFALRERIMIRGLRYRKFIAVSQRVAHQLQKHHSVPANLISVIPNGIDFDTFRPNRTSREDVRKEFQIPLEARLLLFVGNNFADKGLAFAVEALNRLNDDMYLLVAGSGNPTPYRRLFSGRPERLIFAGQRTGMPPLYAAADGFVLPSCYESFSLSCLEAMASGVPVFAARVGGVEDYLVEAENGYWIERDGADIAGKIRTAFADELHLRALRNGARATAERFAWDAVAARYATFLKEVWQEKCASKDKRLPAGQFPYPKNASPAEG
jgi:glycosyltransferase involved in cell wall biosynthesis